MTARSVNAKRATDDDDELLSKNQICSRVVKAAVLGLVMQLVLIVGVYSLTPDTDTQYLLATEREGAKLALWMMILCTATTIGHFIILPCIRSESVSVSPIVIAGLIVNLSAIIANASLAFTPTPVLSDPVLGTKVYLMRWCEWIPTAGVMTYMSDVVSTSKKTGDTCLAVALSQVLSTSPGMMFPFCPNPVVWALMMIIAVTSFTTMFWRLHQKYTIFKNMDEGSSIVKREAYERHKFGLFLFAVCTFVWSLLVFFFFLNAAFTNLLPKDHTLRHEASHLLIDATFDVIAKAFYTGLIVDVHYKVFKSEKFD